MAWEQRGTNRYYYSAKKINGRVVKTYHGNTGLASFVAQMERAGSLAIAAQRLENAAVRADNRNNAAQVERTLAETNEELLSLSVLLLQGDGYHQPKRGPWRKRWASLQRKAEEEMQEFVVPTDSQERRKIIDRALQEGSNKTAQSQAIACLKKYPGHIVLSITRCQEVIFRALADGNATLLEMYTQAGKELWQELAGRDEKTVPYAERLLIDRVVATHFALMQAESTSNSQESRNLRHREYFDRRTERMNRQYLQALKTLAQVRQLNIPMVFAVNAPSATQVNVGGQQINTVS